MAAPDTVSREARIFDAALRCFSEKGFQATTIIDVADAAGVSRPLVYKYFGDKEGLIDRVLRTTFEDWEALHARTGVGESAAQSLEAMFRDAIRFVGQRPIFGSILQRDPQVVTRGHLPALLRCRKASIDSISRILRSGVDGGEFRDDLDVHPTARSLEMILIGLLERALGLRPELDLDPALVRSTLDLVLGGLRAAGSGQPRGSARKRRGGGRRGT